MRCNSTNLRCADPRHTNELQPVAIAPSVQTSAIKAAIDPGISRGPGICPSGALISQTAGHGDCGPDYHRPLTLGGRSSRFEEIGATVASGIAEVAAAVQAQLKRGARESKPALAGGVISNSRPDRHAANTRPRRSQRGPQSIAA